MNIQIQTAPLVNVRVSSNVSTFVSEKRFDRGLCIGDFKVRLELITGASASSMTLEVFDVKENKIGVISDDSALLGSFQVEENYRIHVTDSVQKQGVFDDLSKVEKFELSEKEYNKKTDTVRSFLLRNKLGKYDEAEQKRLEIEKEAAILKEKELADKMKIGDRAEVRVQGEPSRRGVVKFVGETEFKSGLWVGVALDEPLGKNDGSINGKRYFECMMKYGTFSKPSKVSIGDYPEIGDDMDEI